MASTVFHRAQSAQLIVDCTIAHVQKNYETTQQLIDGLLNQVFRSSICLKYWAMAFFRFFSNNGRRGKLQEALTGQIYILLFADLRLAYATDQPLSVFNESAYDVPLKELDFLSLVFLLIFDQKRHATGGVDIAPARKRVSLHELDARRIFMYRLRGFKHLIRFVFALFENGLASAIGDGCRRRQSFYEFKRALGSVIYEYVLPQLCDDWHKPYRCDLFSIFRLCMDDISTLNLRCENAQANLLFQCGACAMLDQRDDATENLFLEIVRFYKKTRLVAPVDPKHLDRASDTIAPPPAAANTKENELRQFFMDMLLRPVRSDDFPHIKI